MTERNAGVGVRLESLPDSPFGTVSVRVVLIFEPDMLNVRWLFIAFHNTIVHPHVAADIYPDLFNPVVEQRRPATTHGVWSPDGKHIVFSSARLGLKDESPL